MKYMHDTSKISIGKLHMDDWLRVEVLDYIKRNPMVRDINIHRHFKMRVDIIATVLIDLRTECEIERIMINGNSYYKIFKFTEEDFQEISLPHSFGNFK